MNHKHVARHLEYWRDKAYGPEKPSSIAKILKREAEELIRVLESVESHPEDSVAGSTEAEVAMGDSLAMIQEICTMMRLDIGELHFKGCQRAAMRCKEKI